MDINKKRAIEAKLKEQRQELIKKRLGNEESWQNLHKNEIEFEESATNEYLAASLDQLDKQDKRRIEEIDIVLGKLQSELYGICDICGEEISDKRLEALPWTTKCIDCAAEMERSGTVNPVPVTSRQRDVEEPTKLSPELEGLSDEQLEMAVLDALQRDGMVETEELIIKYRNNTLRLSGFLPDKRHHSHLRQIVYDVLGFTDVEDMIKIDRTVWERTDRTPGIEIEEEDTEPDSIEESGTETIEAIKEGKTMAPADEIIPEKSRVSKT
ncbi:MAG: TraR/DksA family transcriptional regulator [Desulforhopalus sp.]